jgi:holo-[acyl-carrier protein] synthase
VIHGTGIDIVETDRIASILEKQGRRFLERCFTEAEIAYCEPNKAAGIQSYAARFAAKEAVSKAFGTGIGDKMAFTDIEVTKTPSGKPEIRLHGPAQAYATELGVTQIQLSLTHTKNYAAAVAIVIVRPPKVE